MVNTMKDYINQFKKSYQEARKLKQYIYSLSISEKEKDKIWEKIIFLCIEINECESYKGEL